MFNQFVDMAIVLMAQDESDASSLMNDMDWSFDTYLELFDDDSYDDDDESTIGTYIVPVVASIPICCTCNSKHESVVVMV
jgi:hypothetical protein